MTCSADMAAYVKAQKEKLVGGCRVLSADEVAGMAQRLYSTTRPETKVILPALCLTSCPPTPPAFPPQTHTHMHSQQGLMLAWPPLACTDTHAVYPLKKLTNLGDPIATHQTTSQRSGLAKALAVTTLNAKVAL
jgi:hypothetical protein